MYLEAFNCILVETPKCGTSTIKKALEAKYGKLPLTGHLTEKAMLDWLGERGIVPEYSVVIWRDPVERFFSGFLHVYSDWADMDEALTHAIHTGRASQRIFWPQKRFLDSKIDRKVFRFPPHAALGFLGVEDVPHENQSRKRWTLDDVQHRLPEIEALVADDIEFGKTLVDVKLTKSGKVDRRTRRA